MDAHFRHVRSKLFLKGLSVLARSRRSRGWSLLISGEFADRTEGGGWREFFCRIWDLEWAKTNVKVVLKP